MRLGLVVLTRLPMLILPAIYVWGLTDGSAKNATRYCGKLRLVAPQHRMSNLKGEALPTTDKDTKR